MESATELCKSALKGMGKARKKKKIMERDELKNWDPSFGESHCRRTQSGCELAEWKVENEKSKDVQKKQNLLDKDIRPMADHLDLFQHIYRILNEKADRLTYEAKERRASWNSFTLMEWSKLAVVRACFDGGVSKQEDRTVKHEV